MAHCEITIREAEPGDVEVILHHRRSMFRDMGEGTAEELDRMVEVARPWLERPGRWLLSTLAGDRWFGARGRRWRSAALALAGEST